MLRPVEEDVWRIGHALKQLDEPRARCKHEAQQAARERVVARAEAHAQVRRLERRRRAGGEWARPGEGSGRW